MSLYVYVCMHVCTYVYMQVCINVFMHVYQLSTPLTLYRNLTYVPEQIWFPYCKYDIPIYYAKLAYRPTFWHTCVKTQKMQQVLHMLLSHMCQNTVFFCK